VGEGKMAGLVAQAEWRRRVRRPDAGHERGRHRTKSQGIGRHSRDWQRKRGPMPRTCIKGKLAPSKRKKKKRKKGGAKSKQIRETGR